MKLTKVNIDNLRNYIENNEVVYQVCGELVEVSNAENADKRLSLLFYFGHASGVEAYSKGHHFIHEAFEEIDNWSTDNDVLLLLETMGIVVCIPRKLAIDKQIVPA